MHIQKSSITIKTQRTTTVATLGYFTKTSSTSGLSLYDKQSAHSLPLSEVIVGV